MRGGKSYRNGDRRQRQRLICYESVVAHEGFKGLRLLVQFGGKMSIALGFEGIRYKTTRATATDTATYAHCSQ